MTVMIDTLKRDYGLKSYEGDHGANIEVGANSFNVMSNRYGTNDPASGSGLDGTAVHEAYITDDGNDYIVSAGIVGLFTFSDSATTITMASGSFQAQMWVKVGTGIDSEKMWVTAWNSGTGALTVVRGQLGTTAFQIKPSTVIYQVGDDQQLQIYSQAYKVPNGYWSSIKCISNIDGVGGVRVQAKNFKGDNFTKSHNNYYDPLSGTLYLQMSPGDIVHGKFYRVAVDEPTANSGDKGAKIILYKG